MATLNSSDFKTVWDTTFNTGINGNIFPVRWGNPDEVSYGPKGVTLTSDGSASGFMQADTSTSSGNGYGLYSATFTAPPTQANGVYICMWPGSNAWPGPEIDFFEQSGGKQYATVHWQGANNSNQYDPTFFTADTSKPTTVACDWEKGSLTYYVDGVELVSFKAGGSVPIPKDYADGGQNESFGVGNVGPKGTTITVSDMSYAVSKGGPVAAPVPAPVAPVTPVPVQPVAPIAPLKPVPVATITLSAPGTVEEASKGAGVTITETVSAPGLSTIYESVFTKGNVAEGAWQAVKLDASGKGSFQVHLKNTGDYVNVVNSPTNPTVSGYSPLVTITDPVVVLPKPGPLPVVPKPAPLPGLPGAPEPVKAPGVAGLSISSLTEDAGRLKMVGDKETGGPNTVREFMDGKYLGVLHDGMADGAFSMHLADVTAGAHTMLLKLDGTSATTVYDFLKGANGSLSVLTPDQYSAHLGVASAAHALAA